MTIDEIRTMYTSAGDIIFRTAIGWLTEVGTNTAINEKPDKLLMIEDYVKACAADIAESPEYKSKINDALCLDRKTVYLVYYEDEDTDKYAVGVYSTYEVAMRTYAKTRERIAKAYNLDNKKVEEDDDSICVFGPCYELCARAYISQEDIEE